MYENKKKMFALSRRWRLDKRNIVPQSPLENFVLNSQTKFFMASCMFVFSPAQDSRYRFRRLQHSILLFPLFYGYKNRSSTDGNWTASIFLRVPIINSPLTRDPASFAVVKTSRPIRAHKTLPWSNTEYQLWAKALSFPSSFAKIFNVSITNSKKKINQQLLRTQKILEHFDPLEKKIQTIHLGLKIPVPRRFSRNTWNFSKSAFHKRKINFYGHSLRTQQILEHFDPFFSRNTFKRFILLSKF